MKKTLSAPVHVRLLAEGTRVIVSSSPRMGGVISSVRPQTNLKTYVVTCDDGKMIFASGHEVARDTEAVPVAVKVAPPVPGE